MLDKSGGRIQNPFAYDERIPESVRETFHSLSSDLAWLKVKWDVCLGLFGTVDTVKIVLSISQDSFLAIRDTLIGDVILSISRLCDKEQNRHQQNITIHSLENYCGPDDGILELTASLEDACKPFKTYRHKHLAHKDLEMVLNKEVSQIRNFRESVESILDMFGKTLNKFFQKYADKLEVLEFKQRTIGEPQDIIDVLKAEVERRHQPFKSLSPSDTCPERSPPP